MPLESNGSHRKVKNQKALLGNIKFIFNITRQNSFCAWIAAKPREDLVGFFANSTTSASDVDSTLFAIRNKQQKTGKQAKT